MKYFVAIFFPFVAFFYIKKPISGYFCFVLQAVAFLGLSVYPSVWILFVVWLLLIIWAFFEISDFNNKEVIRRAFKHAELSSKYTSSGDYNDETHKDNRRRKRKSKRKGIGEMFRRKDSSQSDPVRISTRDRFSESSPKYQDSYENMPNYEENYTNSENYEDSYEDNRRGRAFRGDVDNSRGGNINRYDNRDRDNRDRDNRDRDNRDRDNRDDGFRPTSSYQNNFAENMGYPYQETSQGVNPQAPNSYNRAGNFGGGIPLAPSQYASPSQYTSNFNRDNSPYTQVPVTSNNQMGNREIAPNQGNYFQGENPNNTNRNINRVRFSSNSGSQPSSSRSSTTSYGVPTYGNTTVRTPDDNSASQNVPQNDTPRDNSSSNYRSSINFKKTLPSSYSPRNNVQRG